MNKRLASFYRHVDNGGISMLVNQDDEFNVTIDFTTQYFGYPWVTSILNLGSESSPELLEEIAFTLLTAANEV